MKARALLLILVVAGSMMWLAGCDHYVCGTTFGNASCSGSGSGSGTGGTGVNGLDVWGYYVDFNTGKQQVGMAQQELNSSAGSFDDLSGFVPPTLPADPSGLVIANSQYMYLSSSDGTLAGYSINLSTGALTAVASNFYPVAGGNSIATNPAGSLIFVGDTAGQEISVFTVNSGGTVTAVGSPVATSGVTPVMMATDGQSKFLYASAGTGATQVAAFLIGSGGTLTAVTGSPFQLDMAALAGEPTGTYMLGVSGQASDTNIHVFSIGSSGALTDVSGSPFATTNPPTALSVHPNGTWIYAFTSTTASGTDGVGPIEGYTLNPSTGGLTAITGSPFTGLTANAGPIEQSGAFMFALGVSSVEGVETGTVSAYSIDSTTGALSSTFSPLGFPGLGGAAYGVTDAQ